MMRGSDKACKDIVDAFGIKNCIRLQINMGSNESTMVKAEFYPEVDGIMQLIPVIKKYKLVELSKEELEEEVVSS